MKTSIICVSVICLIKIVCGQYEGDDCISRDNNQKGRCMFIDDCTQAQNLLRKGGRPQICGFKRTKPIVCCTGPKSLLKCIEYDEIKRIRRELPASTLVGGESVISLVYPHMAIIGFGEPNDIQWQCGGSLISEKYVLTAAHCLRSSEHGDAKYVRLGDLDIVKTTDDAQPEDFIVHKRIPHPEYKPPSKYHDIALLELDHTATFSTYVKPACLELGSDEQTYDNNLLVATGWGKTGFTEKTSSGLMQVYLKYVPNNVCKSAYNKSKTLSNGIDNRIQVCAGDEGKDTCQGDSGGPLQYFKAMKKDDGVWTILGITSFGKACGLGPSIGVYTRVAPYVSWIEEIVWIN